MSNIPVALVTGGSRGIGRAAAEELAREGYKVALIARTPERLEAAARELVETLGLDAEHAPVTFALDVGDGQAVGDAVDRLAAEWGRIDILVNNAGITQPLKSLEIQPDHYDAVLDVNLRGTLYMSQAVIPVMQRARSGSIVNLSSVSAQRGGGIFGGPHYSAAKAGILGLTKSCAKELAARQITVNAVAPGFIETDMTAALSDEVRASYEAAIPLKRMGTAQEIADAVAFLASDRAAYITGQVLAVNGGMYC